MEYLGTKFGGWAILRRMVEEGRVNLCYDWDDGDDGEHWGWVWCCKNMIGLDLRYNSSSNSDSPNTGNTLPYSPSLFTPFSFH